MRAALVSAALAFAASPLAAQEFTLTLPIDCTLGETCYVQQYVDRDPGPGAFDFRCDRLTYDGHTGTDFAIPSLADMRRGVNVLASAPGVVTGVRDGMADVGYSAANADAIEGRECGNGVVVRHANGWETQYCHMKSGSVAVARGDRVESGTVLGQVGLSGKTQFPHVELSVRRDGQPVDPFDTSAMPACGTDSGDLWQTALPYAPGGLILAGFAPAIPDYAAIKDGTAGRDELAPDAAGLVVFGYGYGGQKGDVMEIRITGPDGVLISQRMTLERDRAQFFRATGKRLTAARWPAGTYEGSVRMLRGQTELGRRDIRMTIR